MFARSNSNVFKIQFPWFPDWIPMFARSNSNVCQIQFQCLPDPIPMFVISNFNVCHIQFQCLPDPMIMFAWSKSYVCQIQLKGFPNPISPDTQTGGRSGTKGLFQFSLFKTLKSVCQHLEIWGKDIYTKKNKKTGKDLSNRVYLRSEIQASNSSLSVASMSSRLRFGSGSGFSSL